MIDKSTLQKLIDQEGKQEIFEHAGLKCVIQRNQLGCWCGYVGVEPLNPLYGLEYDDKIAITDGMKKTIVDPQRMDIVGYMLFVMENKGKGEEVFNEVPIGLVISVHGGLTYSRDSLGDCLTSDPNGTRVGLLYTADQNIWWFGFDCGHSGDLVPAFELDAKFSHIVSAFRTDDVYRDKAYVKEETKHLAEQLANFKLT